MCILGPSQADAEIVKLFLVLAASRVQTSIGGWGSVVLPTRKINFADLFLVVTTFLITSKVGKVEYDIIIVLCISVFVNCCGLCFFVPNFYLFV